MITYPATVCFNKIVDDYEQDCLRVLELALQNPRAGTPAAFELDRLVEKTRHYEAQRYPFLTHPVSGVMCTCKVYCEGIACACWCHLGRERQGL